MRQDFRLHRAGQAIGELIKRRLRPQLAENTGNDAFNERVATSYDQSMEDNPYVVSNTYMLPISYTTPRYVQFSVSYDY